MNNKISINLDQSQTAKPFSSEDIIQKEALKEVELHVEKNLVSVPEFKEKLKDLTPVFECYPRYHSTITISGSRGSGKTSFILSVMKLINDIKNEEYFYKFNKDLSSLGLIDPTIATTKEHILVNIVSRIKTDVTKNYNYKEKKKQDEFDSWKESLEKLAGGLTQLDRVGSNSGLSHDLWDDPTMILDEGLASAAAGYHLEYFFHKFIDHSLKLIEKKAFVIAFDDIDTSFSSGWPVLEVIRMYLTTPQLIVIISGDIELFSSMIRNEQWKHFDKKYLYSNKQRSKNCHIDLSSQVEELEAQYLLKILPPDKRVYLRNINELLEDINIITGVLGSEKQLNEFVESMIKEIFYYRSYKNVSIVKYLIYGLPIRTFLQLLTAYKDNQQLNEQEKNNIFNKVLISIFISTLEDQQYSLTELYKTNSPFCFNDLALKLLNKSSPIDNYRLMPDNMNAKKNILYLILNRLYVTGSKRKTIFKIIDYWIKVGLTQDYFSNYDNDNIEQKVLDLGLSQNYNSEKMNHELYQSYFWVTVNKKNEINHLFKRVFICKDDKIKTEQFYASIFNIFKYFFIIEKSITDEIDLCFELGDEKNINIYDKIIDWNKTLKQKTYPISLWADIFNRFIKILKIKSCELNNITTEKFLQNQILTFFEAVFIEEYLYIRIQNSKFFFFQENIDEKIKESIGGDIEAFNNFELPLFKEFYTCPLWAFFLDPDNKEQDKTNLLFLKNYWKKNKDFKTQIGKKYSLFKIIKSCN